MRPYPGGVLPGRYMAYLSYCGSRIEDCELNTWMTVLWTMTSAIIRKAYGVGDVAQLGERRTRTAEVVGSNPIVSTTNSATGCISRSRPAPTTPFVRPCATVP